MVDPHRESQRDKFRGLGIEIGSEATQRAAILLERLDLSDLDLMTIRDLVQIGEKSEDGCLIGMLGLLFAGLGQGSLCIWLQRDQVLNSVLPADDPLAMKLVNGFMRRLNDGDYDDLIERAGSDSLKPMVLDDTTGRQLLYFQKFHYHERRLKQRLEAFLAHKGDRSLSDDSIQAIIDDLFRDGAVLRKGTGNLPIRRDPDQVSAIQAALTAPLLIISGGPGTGKTSLLVNMLRALVRSGTDPSRILLAAPTGRAAQRMSETLGGSLATITNPDNADRHLFHLRGSTLHKLLVYRPRTGDFLYGPGRPIPADVIVVDEVSMVDVVMMDRLFQATDPERTRVILMGDKDQLPSVEAGSVLADLSPTADNPLSNYVVLLHNVYRSGGQLLELAQAINAGHPVPLIPVSFYEALNLEDGRWAFVAAEGGGTLGRRIDQWVWYQYIQVPKGHAQNYVDIVHRLSRLKNPIPAIDHSQHSELIDRLLSIAFRCRILTVHRHGTTGSGWINDRIALALRQILDPGSNIGLRMFNGALIMVIRNDYRRDLYNGDLGVVIFNEEEGLYYVYFKHTSGIVAFPVSGLPDWDLAFATTVHKSQGSEFEDTLLFLPDDPEHRLLSREILYTAATRASRRLIVHGKQAAFEVARMRKIERQSGLMF